MPPHRPKRGSNDLAPTWWAYCLVKFLKDNGLSKGGLADRIGKDKNTISRWLYEGKIPPKGTIGLIERTWHRDGWFAKMRPEGERWALRRSAHVDARAQFEAAVKHSPVMWMELDDLLRGTGVPLTARYPVSYEVARDLLAHAEAKVVEMPEGPLRDWVEMDIAVWKVTYGVM